jgi:hypothetical protein
MSSTAKWTFMVYMAGDNNLSAAGDKDLTEMRRVGSTADVNVIVEFDNAGPRGTRRYHVQRNGVNERIESLGETDSGSPQTLIDFVAWTAVHYPAERYALVLWNHGSGWEPSEIDRIARSVAARGYSEREATERSATSLGRAFFRTTLETILSLPSSSERAICSDDGSGHSLDTVELGRVLAKVVEAIGQPLDLLGMDACLMSNLEVAYQAQPYVRTIVASEESEPNDGWPYEAVLRRLVDNPDLPTADFAAHIVNAYIQSYVSQGYPGAVTQAALDLSQVQTVVEPLDRLANTLIARLPRARSQIWTAQRRSARFWHNTLWDIAHFSDELKKITRDPATRQAAQDVQTALQRGSEHFVTTESHNGPSVQRCNGVTIYLPAMTGVSRYYGELAYAREHRWLALLQAYHAW